MASRSDLHVSPTQVRSWPLEDSTLKVGLNGLLSNSGESEPFSRQADEKTVENLALRAEQGKPIP